VDGAVVSSLYITYCPHVGAELKFLSSFKIHVTAIAMNVSLGRLESEFKTFFSQSFKHIAHPLSAL
jgi:hypothetical protein